ncbi:MAG TPA: tetratricopeptide repeat protein [Collinsella sp.]|nr:tetratricopeptide repeat protein [Collinsella sp.]
MASAAAETAPVLDRDAVLDAVKAKRSELEGKEGVAAANVLNEIGKLYADANMVDEAVEAYEQSLEVNRTMGKASAALVKLYNKKRAAAAEAKDDEAIKYYMDKVTEMLAISKDQLRGK